MLLMLLMLLLLLVFVVVRMIEVVGKKLSENIYRGRETRYINERARAFTSLTSCVHDRVRL